MPGTYGDTLYGKNIDLSGQTNPAPTITQNGQLIIGSSVANSNGSFCYVNTLTAGSGITITNGPGTITITNSGGSGGGGGTNSLMGNTGSAPAVGGVIIVKGGTNLTTSGDGVQTLTISPTGNLLGLAGLSGTGYVVQTGVGTYSLNSLTAGSGITITNPSGVGGTTITASPIVPTTFTATSGTATPALNNINFLGNATQGVSSSASGSTVTYTVASATTSTLGVASFNATNFTVTSGAVTSNNITVTAGTGLTTGGTVTLGGSVTLALSVPVSVSNGGTGDTTLAAHGVLIGEGTSAVNVTTAGTNGQVLVGGTGVDPAFATVGGTQGVTLTTGSNTLSIGLSSVPNSALQNSSITVTAGSGISVSGSPVSLGGSVTISATGTIVTQFSADTGVATPSGNNINLLGTAAQGISTSGSGSTVTFTIANATTSTKGVASFNSSQFTISSGAVSLNGSGVGTTITGDSGGALSPSSGNWNIQGGTNMKTSGSGSTLTLNVQAPFGATSLTSNSLLLGNGSSNVSALGAATNGQLPIGSTGVAPVLATLTAGSGISITNASGSITINNTNSSPQANAVLDFSDDFLYQPFGGNFEISTYGTWLFTYIGSASSIVSNPASFSTNYQGHPGLIQFSTGSTASGYCAVQQSLIGIDAGFGVITLTWYFFLQTLSNSSQRYTVQCGLAEGLAGPSSEGYWVAYSDNVNSGNWTYNTMAGSVQTNTNSSTPVATGWQVIQIQINAAASSASFFAGTTLANLASLGPPITTNLSTKPVGMYINMAKSVGLLTATMVVDLATLNISLTTAR